MKEQTIKSFGVPDDSLTSQYMKSFEILFNDFPVEVRATQYGFGVFATSNLKKGTKVAIFEGPKVVYDNCTEYDKRYVFLHDPDVNHLILNLVDFTN